MKGADSCRCCGDSSSQVGCLWWVCFHRSKAPEGPQGHRNGGRKSKEESQEGGRK